ncbi:Hypothetical predicted protein [Mytilus galloprovincialis]|uniref:Replication origin-binding protein domain-containing protein n=1 Tax=Mytilus galloprovincialis TaxID=29158 RepID=A0A8B6E1Z8_MYTGA|nr:Hypothetical predicted protein [Mytilus galloprovincialis]
MLQTNRTPEIVDQILDRCFGYPNKVNRGRKFFKHVHHINERYLPSFNKYIQPYSTQTPQILFVKSAMGTGKTARFFDFVASARTVIVISSRVTYTNFMCSENSDFKNYQTISSKKIDHITHPKIIIQFQSLGRILDIDESENYAKWSVCFIDEADSVLKESISSTMSKFVKDKNMKRLSKLITSINTVIVCDANLADWHYEIFMRSIMTLPRQINHLILNESKGLFEDGPKRSLRIFTTCSLSPASFIKDFVNAVDETSSGDPNKIKPLIKIDQHFTKRDNCRGGENISTGEYTYLDILHQWYKKEASSSEILNRFISTDASYSMVNDVRTGKNVVLVCATKRHAQMLYSYFIRFEHLTERQEIFMLTGESDKDDKMMLSDAKSLHKTLSQCRVFIYTSCFKVGIDVSFEHFDNIYVFLNKITPHLTLSVLDVYQMIGRVRKFNSLSICVTLPNEGGFGKKKRTSPFNINKEMDFFDIDKNFKINSIISFANSKISVENKLKEDPLLYMACILKLLFVTMRKPRLLYHNVQVKTIEELSLALKPPQFPLKKLFAMMIQRYEFRNVDVDNLYQRTYTSILQHLANKTPLFSFDIFNSYLGDLSNKIEDVCNIVTLLTTEKGLFHSCAEFCEEDIRQWIKIYHTPNSNRNVRDMVINDEDCYDDVRVPQAAPHVSKTVWIEKIKLLLYNSYELLGKQSITLESFLGSMNDIREVVKFGSRSITILRKLYAVFINHFIPSDDDYITEMIENKFVDNLRQRYNKRRPVNVNAFLVFSVM